MKLSIIIAVYNGERYLEQLFQCLDSQTCKDFEAIFVNDGSTDRVVDRFHELQERYEHVPAVLYSFATNQGVSVARNYGIEKATGELLSCCDADDLLPACYVEYILESFRREDMDAAFWRFMRCDPAKPIRHQVGPLRLSILEKNLTLTNFLYKKFVCGCWCWCCKTSTMKKNGLFYDTELRYGEDLNFVWKVMLAADTIGYINNVLYYYLMQPGSAMSRYDKQRRAPYFKTLELTAYVREKAPEFAPLYERYEWARMLWSLAWQAGVFLNQEQIDDFFDGLPLREAMQALRTFPMPVVRLTARLYLLSPKLFYRAMKIAGRRKCGVNT